MKDFEASQQIWIFVDFCNSIEDSYGNIQDDQSTDDKEFEGT